MPSSILEKSQEISDKNPNIVDPSAQNELTIVLAKPKVLSDIEKDQEKILSPLNEKQKTDLKDKCLSQLQNVRFIDLVVFFKTKLWSGATNFTSQEKTWYGQLYVLAKLSSPEGAAISNDQIVRQIDSVWDKRYLRYGNTPAVRNKNPWNLKMRGDGGEKDERGFAIFSTLEAGWAALTNMVKRWQTKGGSTRYFPTTTLREWATQYDSSNHTYAQTLAQYLNAPPKLRVTVNTKLKDIPVDTLAKGIARCEDGKCYKALKDKGII